MTSGRLTLIISALLGQPLCAAPVEIPTPVDRPQAITALTDPFLQALAYRSGITEFSSRILAAAAALPILGERSEDVAATKAARDQTRSGLFPSLGIDVVGVRTIARNLQSSATRVENLAPLRRSDMIGTVDQLLTDFGATSARIRAGNATNDAARADLDAARNAALLQLVAAWYDVLAAQTAATLAQSNVERMQLLADGAAMRFERGVDSGGDVARARAYLAAAQSQKVGLDRRLHTAEARFVELFGSVPGALHRPDGPGVTPLDTAIIRPEVVAARAQERAAIAALAAAKSDRLPRIEGRISGASYNVLRGSDPVYDVRAQLTLRQRFSTGGAEAARVAQLAAQRRAAGLAVERVAAATTREANVAQADVDGLATAIQPLQAAYLDSRRARDLFTEQFRVARGTLFDVLRAEQDLFDAALALAQTSYELDVARYTLLARNGGLIEQFGLTPAALAADPQSRR
jgi:adhesin transport system outer membrane protein